MLIEVLDKQKKSDFAVSLRKWILLKFSLLMDITPFWCIIHSGFTIQEVMFPPW